MPTTQNLYTITKNFLSSCFYEYPRKSVICQKKTEPVDQGKQKKYKAQKIHKINHPKISKNLYTKKSASCETRPLQRCAVCRRRPEEKKSGKRRAFGSPVLSLGRLHNGLLRAFYHAESRRTFNITTCLTYCTVFLAAAKKRRSLWIARGNIITCLDVWYYVFCGS